MQNQIKASNIIKEFGKTIVLNGINIHVEAGEIFGLLGPSGAGKTTLIKILTGQIRQTEGTAWIMDTDSRKLTNEVRAGIGMVTDNSGLYERLACRDNLQVFADIYGVSRKKIPEALDKVGLSHAEKTPVNKLSKGMRQRLVLARAIMHSPRVLFLDEPTSGLDPATSVYIHQLIQRERDRGTSIFMTTHNMEEASKMCSRVALLHDGIIVEEGRPEEICRKYNHQKKIRILLKNGEEILIKHSREEAETIADYFREESVAGIHSTEPDLETVFMELTGRKFEEYENEENARSIEQTNKGYIKE